MNKIATFILSLILFLFIFPLASVLGQENSSTSQGQSEEVEEVNSFELFWPMVAGKTTDDGFVYSLKKLKENVRGMVIFGKVEKADYLVFLATKRVLEAEKLISENKYELANKTLDDALNQLSTAEGKIQGFTGNEKANARTKEMVARFFNMEKLASLLASRESDSSDKLKEVTDKVSSIAEKLQD